MNFTVEWTTAALVQLAETWTESDDRAGVTTASHRIESAIRQDPTGAGESREGSGRIVFDPPLAVIYHVFPAERLAVVTAVSLSRRPR